VSGVITARRVPISASHSTGRFAMTVTAVALAWAVGRSARIRLLIVAGTAAAGVAANVARGVLTAILS
jgi:hypothetical protein